MSSIQKCEENETPGQEKVWTFRGGGKKRLWGERLSGNFPGKGTYHIKGKKKPRKKAQGGGGGGKGKGTKFEPKEKKNGGKRD